MPTVFRVSGALGSSMGILYIIREWDLFHFVTIAKYFTMKNIVKISILIMEQIPKKMTVVSPNAV